VWDAPAKLMDFYSAGGAEAAPLAIYYGKVAINTLQQLRGNLSGASSDTQTSFVDAVAPIYRRLPTCWYRPAGWARRSKSWHAQGTGAV